MREGRGAFSRGSNRPQRMIDIAVLYPDGEKEPRLRQLHIMAHTFKTADEVTGNKREEPAHFDARKNQPLL